MQNIYSNASAHNIDHILESKEIDFLQLIVVNKHMNDDPFLSQ